MKLYQSVAVTLVSLLMFACISIPKGVEPVNDFEKSRYLGTWYEIARLDHPFERGLEQITATYTLREDGGISVLNKGFNTDEQTWTDAEGKAYFVGADTVGHLKVSFFGPFYASYVIADLDMQNYGYALVTGPDTDYLWILARQAKLDEEILDKLTSKAKAWGFAVENMIYVNHSDDQTN